MKRWNDAYHVAWQALASVWWRDRMNRAVEFADWQTERPKNEPIATSWTIYLKETKWQPST